VLKHRPVSLAAITIVSATMLTALAATSASASTAVAVSSQSAAAGNAAGHAASASQLGGRGDAVRVVRPGLAQGCEYIKNSLSGGAIAGHGVNEPVTVVKPGGNCFTPIFQPAAYDGYAVYEYQNGDGHCLWNDDGTLELGAACKSGHPNEEFFGMVDTPGLGWTVGNETDGTSQIVNSYNCTIGARVVMAAKATAGCGYWNFPQG
jgi:hypothetical protein